MKYGKLDLVEKRDLPHQFESQGLWQFAIWTALNNYEIYA